MTDRPYTDEDLRTEAAKQHQTLTEDPDFMCIGERMEDSTVASTKDGTASLTWAALLVPEGDTYEAFDEPQRAIHKLINRAADTSRWAVDLGADGLEPSDEHVDIAEGIRIGVRVHFAFHPDLPGEIRRQVIDAIREDIAVDL